MESLIDLATRKGVRRLEIGFPIRARWARPIHKEATIFVARADGLSDIFFGETIEDVEVKVRQFLSALDTQEDI